MNLLITGCAGFIGFHLALKRLSLKETVVGVDNLNNYYDVNLKKERLKLLKQYPNFIFHEADICNKNVINNIFIKHKPQLVINLAAQAGVRYSLDNPQAYINSNVTGFLNILEACRFNHVKDLIYASSSSVYGDNENSPYNENDKTDKPLAIYAATKKANELMAHSYSHLYKLKTTGLRFFTVYGPWGRPDMAFFSFTKNIINNIPIEIYNHGKMQRDFTYIDDIINGISLIIDNKHVNESLFNIYNIGSGTATTLMHYIEEIESTIGKKAIKTFLPMQAGDVKSTHADISKLKKDFGYNPAVDVKDGIQKFISWYKKYYAFDMG